MVFVALFQIFLHIAFHDPTLLTSLQLHRLFWIIRNMLITPTGIDVVIDVVIGVRDVNFDRKLLHGSLCRSAAYCCSS